MDIEELKQKVTSPEALEDIRAFEAERVRLAELEDADKPDKRSTHFVNAADLAWAWIASTSTHGLLPYARKVAGAELIDAQLKPALAEIVAQWEYSDPCYVAMIEEDGGLA